MSEALDSVDCWMCTARSSNLVRSCWMVACWLSSAPEARGARLTRRARIARERRREGGERDAAGGGRWRTVFLRDDELLLHEVVLRAGLCPHVDEISNLGQNLAHRVVHGPRYSAYIQPYDDYYSMLADWLRARLWFY